MKGHWRLMSRPMQDWLAGGGGGGWRFLRQRRWVVWEKTKPGVGG